MVEMNNMAVTIDVIAIPAGREIAHVWSDISRGVAILTPGDYRWVSILVCDGEYMDTMYDPFENVSLLIPRHASDEARMESV